MGQRPHAPTQGSVVDVSGATTQPDLAVLVLDGGTDRFRIHDDADPADAYFVDDGGGRWRIHDSQGDGTVGRILEGGRIQIF